MSDTNRPRIRLLGPGNWECADAYLARCGKSPRQAYDLWLAAALRDAMGQVDPQPATKPDLAAAVASLSKAAEPVAAVLRKFGEIAKSAKPAKPTPRDGLRQKGTAIPKKAGQPITVKAAKVKPAPKPIEQPSYHESMVRRMPSPLSRREYVPSAGLQRNMARAAEVQPTLISISANNRSEH